MPGIRFRLSSDTISKAVRLAGGYLHRTISPPQIARQPFFDAVRDGQHLALGIAVKDDEVVGDVAAAAQIEHDRILGILVQRGLDAERDLEGYLGAQRSASCR